MYQARTIEHQKEKKMLSNSQKGHTLSVLTDKVEKLTVCFLANTDESQEIMEQIRDVNTHTLKTPCTLFDEKFIVLIKKT